MPGPRFPQTVWLEKAEGNVVTSIEKTALWNPKLDASTVGLGLGLGLMTNPKIANFNAMLSIEEPGPRILLFAKLNLLKDPESNDKEPKSLGKGILGLLKIDPAASQIIFAALADIEFNSLAHVRAPIEIEANREKLSAWHVYIGRFDDPVTATLKVQNIASLTAKGWLMAAGDEISRVPRRTQCRNNASRPRAVGRLPGPCPDRPGLGVHPRRPRHLYQFVLLARTVCIGEKLRDQWGAAAILRHDRRERGVPDAISRLLGSRLFGAVH